MRVIWTSFDGCPLCIWLRDFWLSADGFDALELFCSMLYKSTHSYLLNDCGVGRVWRWAFCVRSRLLATSVTAIRTRATASGPTALTKRHCEGIHQRIVHIGLSLCLHYPTLLAKALRYWAVRPPRSSVHSSGQNVLPWYLMNGLIIFDKTCGEFLPTPTYDCIRFWRSKVKVTAGGWDQILWALDLVNYLSNLDESYGVLPLARTDDLVGFWRSEVKVTAGCRGDGASRYIF